MQFITLTTDMGCKDYYVASLKASIFQQLNTSVHIIDITHHVEPFNVIDAAFHIGQAFHNFPSGSIHIIGVDSEPIIKNGVIHSHPSVMLLSGHYFISNDNGFFSALVHYSKDTPIFYRIKNEQWKDSPLTFSTKSILVPIACELARGTSIKSLGKLTNSYQKALHLIPTIEEFLIKGIIIHFDSFGNAITNIDRSLFQRIGKNTSFTIEFRKGDDYRINRISSSYSDVPSGEKLAIFNENDWLELAINQGANTTTGGAQTLFGLNKYDTVTVKFASPKKQNTKNDSLL